jgi:hypothetical protein
VTLSERFIGAVQSPAKQFYVSQAAGGNPVFNHEPSYGKIKLPDAGYQLLALFRFWNIIEYWFPYRNVIGENWTPCSPSSSRASGSRGLARLTN